MHRIKQTRKIIFVTPYFFPKIGGLENYAYNICKGLKYRYKWDVVVITSNHVTRKYEEDLIDGIKIFRLPYWFKISNTPINPLWFFSIKKIINEFKPDIINAYTPVPFIADIACLVKSNTKLILTYLNDLDKSNLILKIIIFIYQLILGNNTLIKSAKIIAISNFYLDKSTILSKYSDKISVISPGVNTEIFVPTNTQPHLKVKNILFVGNLDKTNMHKGLNYLLEAISYIKKCEIKLIIVGKGDAIDIYKKQIKRLHIENIVEFFQAKTDIELAKYYNRSDVVVLPSYNNSEGFGMVLLEAGACGKPVIGTKVGGVPYAVNNNKTGLLVEPKDSKALSKAIYKIINNPILAKKMGKNGRDRVKEKFKWIHQIKRYNDVISFI